MTQPTDQRSEMGPVVRGVMLTALAVAVGVGVLSSISRIHTTPSVAVSTPPTTRASASTSTTTTTLATHPPSAVKVLVANGTTTKGVAGKLATKLNTDGYDTLAATNTSSTVSASAVYYATGYQGDADAVASASGLTSAAVQPLTSSVPVSPGSAEVVVVVGPDLAANL